MQKWQFTSLLKKLITCLPVVKKSSKIVRHCFQKGLSTQGAYNFNLDLKPGQNPAGADVCLTGKNLFVHAHQSGL